MKKLFKKVVICLTAVFSLAAFSACYKPNTSGQSVLTSFYPVYLITQRITNGTEINVQDKKTLKRFGRWYLVYSRLKTPPVRKQPLNK